MAQKMTTAIVTPAYGRDYKDSKAALADWEANKDFIIQNVTDPWEGKPCNKSDLSKSHYTHVNIRYNKRREVLRLEL